MSEYKKTVTSNGVRVVSQKLANYHSAALGLWVDTGSRDEADTENGVSHFIEHMVFKGTETRSAFAIASALESLGGNINAFTSREQTCFYARTMGEHLPIAADILIDMLMHSTFAPDHIDKERNVIIEEIKDVFDTPSDYIHDLFAQATWGDHPLGQPILGTHDLVGGMTRDALLGYKNRNYTAGKIVVAAAGDVEHERLVDWVEDKLKLDPQEPVFRDYEATTNPRSSRITSYRDSSQTHLCVGFPAYHFTHPNKFALLMLHNMLGAGMSSRLFQAVREELGFAYSVYTYEDFYRDCGTFNIYAATDAKNAVKAVDVILSEILKIRKNSITADELESARQQLMGNLVLGLEGTSARMNRLARHELAYNAHVPVEDSLRFIQEVTLDDVKQALDDVFNGPDCAAAFLGPVDETMLDEVDWGILSS